MSRPVPNNDDQSKRTVELEKCTLKKRDILADLDEAVKQVKLHKEGKIKLKTIQEVLDGL